MKNYPLMIIVGGLLLFVQQMSHSSIACLENWYFAASPSVAWHNDHKFSIEMLEAKLHSHRQYKTGWGGNASIGYLIKGSHCLDFRVESEFVYRENDLKNMKYYVKSHGKHAFGANYSSCGHTKDAAIMLNLLTDIPLYSSLKLYLGLGLGISYNRLTMKTCGDRPWKSPFSRNTWLPAQQFMGGFSYECTNCLTLTMGYRLFATSHVHSSKNLQRSTNTPYTQSIDLGFRFRL